MTKPIPRRDRRPVSPPVGLRRWLISGERNHWYYLDRRDPVEAVWAEHCDDVVLHHIKRHPGTRPKLWWRYSAPEPRRRVGGIGTPLHECGGAWAELYEYGVPADWRTPRQNGYLTHGVPISAEFPPMFESEPHFLRRHGLLLPEERRRLRQHHFEPVVLRHRGDRFQLVRHDRAR
jgi:hypothetical protein